MYINTDEEVWKDVKGYEGHYQVSNLGRVRSLDRLDRIGQRRNGTVKKPQDNGSGYKYVQLKLDGKYKNFYIHRLVGEYFIEKVSGKNFINHIDGNKENNRVENLEWVTSNENMQHAYDTGLNIPGNQKELRAGREKHYRETAKKVIQRGLDGNVIKVHDNMVEAHKYIGKKSTGFIHRVCKTGKTAYGYKWEYID